MFTFALVALTALTSLVAAAPSAGSCPACPPTFAADNVTYVNAEAAPTAGNSTLCGYEVSGGKQIAFDCSYGYDNSTLIADESSDLCPTETDITMACSAACPACPSTFANDNVTYINAEEYPTAGEPTMCGYVVAGGKQIAFDCFYDFDNSALDTDKSSDLCPTSSNTTMACSFSK